FQVERHSLRQGRRIPHHPPRALHSRCVRRQDQSSFLAERLRTRALLHLRPHRGETVRARPQHRAQSRRETARHHSLLRLLESLPSERMQAPSILPLTAQGYSKTLRLRLPLLRRIPRRFETIKNLQTNLEPRLSGTSHRLLCPRPALPTLILVTTDTMVRAILACISNGETRRRHLPARITGMMKDF